jgi:hypothetical protein
VRPTLTKATTEIDMSVYIFDADALAKLAAVEGQPWAEQQARKRQSPYGFYAWLAAWQEKESLSETYPDASVRDFLENGDGTIYGDGGYARYVVCSDGELVLLGSSTRDAKKAVAVAQGFTVR